MKFWDDSLRLCPKCKAKTQIDGEPHAPCPKCGARVWFYNFRPIEPPTEIPGRRPSDLWSNPTTTLLLIATGVFGLVALVGFFVTSIVAVTCGLGAVGFAVFGFLRHSETRGLEQQLEHAAELAEYGELLRERTRDAVSRYKHLLRVGDQRIEHYYEKIYMEARNERLSAEALREAARHDREAVRHVETRIYSMAERLIQDHLKWVANKLRPDPESYQRQKLTLIKTFDFVESVGYELPKDLRDKSMADLKARYKEKVREQALKDEQRRIKQQMREEERLRREQEQAIREAEEKERELQQRLQEILRDQAGEHAEEIAELQRQLADAHAGSERAKSMAQQTKVGHVYILSNIGSFGEGIFKVGMTRRLEPSNRIRELSDASVPFPFDIHAMFSCEDAPKLENALHRELTQHRVNRVNFRKEYFQVQIDAILDAVRRHHGTIEYVAEPEVLEYRESLQITPEQLLELTNELVEVGVSFSDDEEDEA